MSVASRTAAIDTYGRTDGWEVTGLDWETRETIHRTVFGHVTAGNGAYALEQLLPDGDMIITSIAGPVRVPLSSLEPTLL